MVVKKLSAKRMWAVSTALDEYVQNMVSHAIEFKAGNNIDCHLHPSRIQLHIIVIDV